MVESPFGGEALDEIRLKDSPLVRVLTQVRFPVLGTLRDGDALAVFGRALADDYPIIRDERGVGFLIGPEGVAQGQNTEVIHRWVSGDDQWQVSLGSTFLALDTSAYVSRSGFCERFDTVLSAFAEAAKPPKFERVGVRYVNQIANPEHLAKLKDLVRPEVFGAMTIPEQFSVELALSVCESQYEAGDQSLRVRWGSIPAGAVLDPSIPPAPVQSWVLDLDAYQTGSLGTDAGDLGDLTRRLAENAYRYFLWVVTPEFLTTFGGV